MDSKRRDDGRLPHTVLHAVEPGGEVVCGGDMGSTCNADGGWFNEQFASNNYFLGTIEREQDEPVRVRRCGRQDWNVHLQDTGRQERSDLARSLAHHRGVHSRPQARSAPAECRPAVRRQRPLYCALFIPNCQAGAWGGASVGHQGGANLVSCPHPMHRSCGWITSPLRLHASVAVM